MGERGGERVLMSVVWHCVLGNKTWLIHHDFWSRLPALVADGVTLVFCCRRARRVDYEML